VTVTVAQHKTALEIDVARRPGGGMSGWFTREDAIGSSVLIEGPFGNCVAQEDLAPLIAVGAGSGIGAALGVLHYSHRRWPMRATALLAYGVQANDIYGVRKVADSAAAAGVQHFARASVEEPPVPADMSHGRAPAGLVAAFNDAAAMARADGERDCQVLLYGAPGFVDCCVDVLVRTGVSAERICFDRYQPYSAARSPAPAQQR
jgi:ferredoxin-NADP reductase